MTNSYKDILLCLTFILSYLPKIFYGSSLRYNLSLFVERSTRVDFFAMHYSNTINFLILAYCLHFKDNIDNRITLFILVITILDFFHLLLFAKQGYGITKIGLAILIFYTLKKWFD